MCEKRPFGDIKSLETKEETRDENIKKQYKKLDVGPDFEHCGNI